jgi:hypothetical protein
MLDQGDQVVRSVGHHVGGWHFTGKDSRTQAVFNRATREQTGVLSLASAGRRPAGRALELFIATGVTHGDFRPTFRPALSLALYTKENCEG